MSLSRLLRAERLAKRSTPPQKPPGLTGMAALVYAAKSGGFEDLVRAAAELKQPLVMDPLPPPEPPTPQAPPSAETKPAPVTARPPQPEPPRQWWEERCHWRERTAADDYDDAKPSDEDDDPLGIYS